MSREERERKRQTDREGRGTELEGEREKWSNIYYDYNFKDGFRGWC